MVLDVLALLDELVLGRAGEATLGLGTKLRGEPRGGLAGESLSGVHFEGRGGKAIGGTNLQGKRGLLKLW